MTETTEAIGRGRAALKARQFDTAAEAFRRALDHAPDDLVALFGLGNALLEARRDAEAVAPLERALALKPGNPDIGNSLGIALRRLKRYGEAIPHLETAAAAYPDRAGILVNLANAQRADQRLDAAAATYRRAVALDETATDAWYGLGAVYRMAGMLDEALPYLDHALARDPDHADARFSRALLHLERGNFLFGFADFERRWDASDFPGRTVAGTEWTGDPVAGRTVLVHAEQGIGDTIQFARYAPMLAAFGARVLVYAQPELVPVLETLRGVAAVLPAGGRVPPYDRYVAVMSLPFHFGTTLRTIPADIPYLSAPPAAGAILDDLLPARPAGGLRVGLTWAGRPSHADDRARSCRLADLLPLAEVAGVTLFSLQKAPRDEDRPQLGRIVDLGPRLADFGVTAAAMARLDLVISVDTATAHLAGALGRPTWLMLPHRAEWRWAPDEETSPWYPTMRLARQPAPGDWAGVVARLAEGLTQAANRTA